MAGRHRTGTIGFGEVRMRVDLGSHFDGGVWVFWERRDAHGGIGSLVFQTWLPYSHMNRLHHRSKVARLARKA